MSGWTRLTASETASGGFEVRIVGTREIADLAQVKRGTVAQWRKRHDSFPEPVVVLATGPVWDWNTVRIWLERTERI